MYGKVQHAKGLPWIASEAKTKRRDSYDSMTGGHDGKALKKLIKSAQDLSMEGLSLEKAFETFRGALVLNPHVSMAILRRRFELLTVLERGSKGGQVPVRR